MIAWLLAMPAIVALIVLPFRKAPFLTIPLSAGALMIMSVLCASITRNETMLVFGRVLSLTPREAVVIAYCCGLLALTIVCTYRVPQTHLTYSLALGCVALFSAAIMMQSLVVGILLLELGVILATMVLPSKQARSATSAARTLVLVVVVSALLLVASWALEARAARPDDMALARLALTTLTVGAMISLGIGPFAIWLAPIYRDGHPLAAVLLGVVWLAVALLRIDDMLVLAVWPEGQTLLAQIFLQGGILTCVFASVGALLQRSVSRILAYAAIADLGIVLIGLGLGSEMVTGVTVLHFLYRGLAILLVAWAAHVLRDCLDSDDIDQLTGAQRFAPLAVLGMAVGGFSLAGLPFTASFVTRFSILRALAAEHVSWALLILVTSIGPAWAFARCTITSLTSALIPEGRREPLLPGLWTIPICLALVALGIFPGLLNLMPDAWLLLISESHLLWGG